MMLFFAFVVSDGGNQKISFRTPKKLDDTWVLYRQGESDEQIIDLPTKLKACIYSCFKKKRFYTRIYKDVRGPCRCY